jgi:hypothetical protein
VLRTIGMATWPTHPFLCVVLESPSVGLAITADGWIHLILSPSSGVEDSQITLSLGMRSEKGDALRMKRELPEASLVAGSDLGLLSTP